jgi:2-iminobutanoate/2-iminopropanoate deaminase
MKKQVITTTKAPKAVGPYSQGIRAGDTIYVAGQIALDPETGKLVEGDITVQTKRVLNNIAAVLEAAGSSLEWVVNATVFLRNLEDFKAFNATYAEFFQDNPPARLTVGVGDIFLGALIEMDAIAIVPD